MSGSNLLKKVFPPNRISAYGGLSSLTGVALLTNSFTMPLGAAFVAAGYACDYVDGKVAKTYSMKTLEGAKLDPLVDKMKNFLVGGYVAVNDLIRGGVALPITMTSNFIVDYVSQQERGDILDQLKSSCRAIWDPESCQKDDEGFSKLRANFYGKAKTAIQAFVNLGYIGAEIANNYFDKIDMDYVSPTLASALVLSAGLGVKGIIERRKV